MSSDDIASWLDADEQFMWLAAWAARRGLALQIAGEVGFGRECVGLLAGNCYVDYDHIWSVYGGDVEFWTPPDAYHKHPCLAVLGRGSDALAQLYEWVRWLDEHGWTVETVDRSPSSNVDMMIHGVTTTRLTRAGANTTNTAADPPGGSKGRAADMPLAEAPCASCGNLLLYNLTGPLGGGLIRHDDPAMDAECEDPWPDTSVPS